MKQNLQEITKSLIKGLGTAILVAGLATSANAYNPQNKTHLGGVSIGYTGSLFQGTAKGKTIEFNGLLNALNPQTPNYLKALEKEKGFNWNNLSTGEKVGLGVLGVGIIYVVTKDDDKAVASVGTGQGGSL